MRAEGLRNLAGVGGAVGDVTVVVVGGQHLGVHGGDVHRAAGGLVVEVIGLGHTRRLAQLLHQRLAQVPEGAGDDQTGGVRVAADVVRPHRLAGGGSISRSGSLLKKKPRPMPESPVIVAAR